MIREVQTHPVRRRFLHVDFYEVAMDKAIEVEVPIELTGKPAGAEKGGIVNLVRRVLSVKCLPGEIPEKIPVDISSLDIGDAIHVEDLLAKVPFELIEEQHFTVVTINAPEGAEEEAEIAESEEGEEVEG
jgi:large subunit ribosomal protein L25